MGNVYHDRWMKKYSYEYGRIYHIINVVTGDDYVGVTTRPVKKRLYEHITKANLNYDGLLYENIRMWGSECFDIKCLYECKEHEDMFEIEKEYIWNVNPSLNKNNNLF